MRRGAVPMRMICSGVFGLVAASIATGQMCGVQPPNVFDVTTSPTQSAFSTSQVLFAQDGTAYFSALIPGAGNVLYRSDGTSAGTVPFPPGQPASATASTPIAWSPGGLVAVDVSASRASIVTPTGVTVFDAGFRQAMSSLPLSQHFLNCGGALVYQGQPFGQPVAVYGVTFPSGVPTRQTLLTLPATDWRVSPLVRLGSRCVFAINQTSTLNATRIYVTDGTPGGTMELIDSMFGCASGACYLGGTIDDFLVLSGRVYFARFVQTGPGTSSWQLWSTDGTPAGTLAVPGIAPSYLNGRPKFLGAIGAKIIMSGFTDFAVPPGTTSGLHVYDTLAGAISFVPYLTADPMTPDRTRAIDLGGRLIFAGRNSGSVPDTQATEPWVTDGTIAGTFALGDLNPGPVNSINPSSTSAGVVVNGRAIFGAIVNSGGTLWSSDGTSAGTQQIAGPEVSSPVLAGTFAMISTGDRGFFGAASTTTGYEPWITDGTPAGTRLLADLNPGTTSSDSVGFAPITGGVVFHAAVPGVGNELHFTDGASTTLVKDIAEGTVSTTLARMLPYENKVAIFATSVQTGVAGVYEWSGGRSPGVQRLAPPIAPLESQPFGLEYVPGFGMYFTTPSRLFLASPDLSSAAAVAAAPGNLVQIPNFGTAPLPHALIGTSLLFPAIDNGAPTSAGQELCITDGTPTGTRMVKDISPGSASSGPQNFVSLGSRAVFYAMTPANGSEPWGTDGTEAGTVALGDLFPGTGSSVLTSQDQSSISAAVFGGQAFFAARTSNTMTRMYLSDGTPAGTRVVDTDGVTPLGLLAAGDQGVYFVGSGPLGSELYVTDGSFGGSRLVADVTPGPTNTTWSFVTGAGSRAFFSAIVSSPTRAQLYVTDDTPAGFSPVPWPVPGETPGGMFSVGVVRGTLVFVARIGATYRLAISDGTAAGTCVLGPWTGITPSSTPGWQPVIVNSRLFAWANDPLLGREPTAWDLCPADFNNSGGPVTVQDVFDFLDAFFSSDSSADFNNSGGTPTTQDVFDFLTAWFAGC